MRTWSLTIPAILLLAACGSVQETVQVRDDVYDIPDRNAMASITPIPGEARPEVATEDDYYNPSEAKSYEQGSYWDQTYNDPQWYNQDRFGFGYSMSPWGNSLSMSYGMGYGNNTMYNSPTGWYDPYWGNSWQSGYGAWNNPCGCNPWQGGYYDPWGASYQPSYWGWGGNPCGYYGYGSGWNNGGYGSGYGGGYYDHATPLVIAHRPSMNSVGGGVAGGTSLTPRAARQISLLPDPTRTNTRPSSSRLEPGAPTGRPGKQKETWLKPSRTDRGDRPDRPQERERRPSNGGISTPSIDTGGGGSGRGGGSGGGGSSPSPSPRPPR